MGSKFRSIKLLNTSLLFIVVFVLLILISVLVVFGVVRFQGKDDEATVAKKVYKYKWYETDPSVTTIISKGNMEIFDKLDSGDYEYSQDENGNHNLISKIGLNGFKCTGNCFCEEEERRSSMTTTSLKSIKYLVAAASSLVTLKIAKKYFEEECEKKITDENPMCFSVQSEVEGCESIDDSSTDDSNSKEEEDNKNKVLHAFVSGRVQGVFFRESTKTKANEIGEITGFVKNLPDSRVEVWAESKKMDKLEMLLRWLYSGSPSAEVQDVQYKFILDEKKRYYDSFKVIYRL